MEGRKEEEEVKNTFGILTVTVSLIIGQTHRATQYYTCINPLGMVNNTPAIILWTCAPLKNSGDLGLTQCLV